MAETTSGWETLTVKVTPQMRDRVEQFQEEVGEESTSSALRLLIAAGLESKLAGDGADLLESVKANAKGQVMYRWKTLLDSALDLFWNDEYEVSEPEGD